MHVHTLVFYSLLFSRRNRAVAGRVTCKMARDAPTGRVRLYGYAGLCRQPPFYHYLLNKAVPEDIYCGLSFLSPLYLLINFLFKGGW